MIALDPVTGNARWTFDPQVDRRREYSQVVSRGVAAWRDSDVPAAASRGARIYIGTIDARLIAIDAATGRRCDVFGQHGEIDLAAPVTMSGEGDYQVTSPPVIVNGVVIVGSSISHNWNVDTGSGVVRAFDARTGPCPEASRCPGRASRAKCASRMTGASSLTTDTFRPHSDGDSRGNGAARWHRGTAPGCPDCSKPQPDEDEYQ